MRWLRIFRMRLPGHNITGGDGRLTGDVLAGSELDATENLYGKQVEKR
jgi:hypothetical protein